MPKTKAINQKLIPLENKDIARAYLNAISFYNPNDTEQFMVGLKHVITAQGGKDKLAKQMNISHSILDKILETTDPKITDILHILKILNINLQIQQQS